MAWLDVQAMGGGDLTDAEWERLRPFLSALRSMADHRQVIDGILHRCGPECIGGIFRNVLARGRWSMGGIARGRRTADARIASPSVLKGAAFGCSRFPGGAHPGDEGVTGVEHELQQRPKGFLRLGEPCQVNSGEVTTTVTARMLYG